MMRRRGRSGGAALGAALVLALSSVASPGQANAQVLPAALGFTGGLIGGAYVTTGVYVFKSRATGWVLHSASELLAVRLEALPVAVMPVAGAIVGHQDRHRLAAAASWGGVGLVAGAAVGTGFGQLIWGTSEGRWAGGTIGSAAGLAVGAVIGALTHGEEGAGAGQGGARAPYLTFSFPLGGGR